MNVQETKDEDQDRAPDRFIYTNRKVLLELLSEINNCADEIVKAPWFEKLQQSVAKHKSPEEMKNMAVQAAMIAALDDLSDLALNLAKGLLISAIGGGVVIEKLREAMTMQEAKAEKYGWNY